MAFRLARHPALSRRQAADAALGQFPLTLVHGDWRHANQGLLRDNGQTRVLLLDWQLATAAPPVVDLARFLIANSPLLPLSKEATIAFYRARLAHYLGPRFADDWWQPQLELGLLGGFLQDGWAVALKATHWHVGASARAQWQADLQWWSAQVRLAQHWLVS
ncbi:MAG: phosphotransferase [Anaerolineae bacterium]|nr:phosphotransferase [Anaerolineae bacterium]